MRIGVLSDLHVDLNGGRAVVDGLLQAMRGSRIQAMIIAGDVSSDYRLNRRQLSVDGTRFVCNCLGYRDEWSGSRDPAAEIEKAFLALELD